jgi:uncharacterized membrane protein YfcA
MANDIPKGLQWMFLIHFFVGAFFGVGFLFFHQMIFDAVNWIYSDQAIIRLLGGALIAISTSSLLAWREKELDRVKIVMEMELVWLVLAVVASIYGAILTINWLAWVIFAQFTAFLVGFGYYYRQSF